MSKGRQNAVAAAKQIMTKAESTAMDEALKALYDQGYVDGQISTGQAPNPPADVKDVAAQIEEATAPLHARIEELEGVAGEAAGLAAKQTRYIAELEEALESMKKASEVEEKGKKK